MAGSVSGNDTEISGINITPLVDIMLVLVIILMVTAEFTKYRTVPIALPKVNAAAVKKEPQKVALTVQMNGDVIWNDRKIDDIQKLPAMLKTAKKLQPEVAVILRAEGEIQYQKLLDILDEVKMAGIAKVGLAVDSAKKDRQLR
ncbi:MAG TPA: biopolymer transporter ExbD [Spirochaetota bacterium]|nr:biopolymer transporter ExbD [Spirochaetota bacterium]HPI89256.1 biopolymer transporter ExbD [Spirochaetota bacterium]HPR48584.1 biopolymer transporter ExbD [Spirochaetota bacterium]